MRESRAAVLRKSGATIAGAAISPRPMKRLCTDDNRIKLVDEQSLGGALYSKMD